MKICITKNNKKRKMVFVILLLFVICVILSIVRKPAVKAQQESINIMAYRDFVSSKSQEIEKLFPNRCYKVQGSTISFGNTVKELENGYFDIQVKEENGKLKIMVNKLYFEQLPQDKIEPRYIEQLEQFLIQSCNLSWRVEERNAFAEQLKESYLRLRNTVEYVDKKEEILGEKWTGVNVPVIQEKFENNMLVLECSF